MQQPRTTRTDTLFPSTTLFRSAFGGKCGCVGIDSWRDTDGEWRVRQYAGDPSKTRALPRRTLDWMAEAQRRGAGEIVLNCMDSDGVRRGYDLEQLQAARAICRVPLVASDRKSTRLNSSH